MPFRIAALCTQYFPYSHADVIITRWLEQVQNDPRLGFVPCTKIASLWVMQHPQGDPPIPVGFDLSPNHREERFVPTFDISRAVALKYGVPIFDTIRGAMALGTGQLAVDAVLLIGEHGDFPTNDYGQKQYPRKELFDEVVAVFRAMGKIVPVFCDKHLSWNIEWAQQMVSTAQQMGIPFFAGSNVPISGTRHELRMDGEDIAESMGLYYAGGEVYGTHSIEFVQSLAEKRGGGESGIMAIRAYEGEAVWEAMDRGEWSRDLFETTLAAATTAQTGDFRENCRRSTLAPVALVCEHIDGHKQSHIMLDGHIAEFIAGAKLRGGECRASTANMGGLNDFVVNFAHLDREIQKSFLTSQPPIAIERVLLSSMLVATFMRALKDAPGQRVTTPHLVVPYRGLPYLPVRVKE